MGSLLGVANQYKEELIQVMEALHRRPELSFQEIETTAFLKDRIQALGLELIDLGMETGLVALLKGGKPGPLVGLRADMDAVPVQEDPRHKVKSEREGVAHACGHDFHMTSALGAAMVLAARRESLAGDVVFLFQPAEEITRGAQAMLDHGLLDKLPRPMEALFGLHASPHLATGQVISSEDYASAGKSNFKIQLMGTMGHSGSPHEYQDVIPAAAALVSAIQTLTSRENDPQKPLVCAVHTLHTEGPEYFVTDQLVMTGSIRAFDPALMRQMEKRLEELADQMAKSYACHARTRIIPEVPPQVNHPGLLPAARRACAKVFGPDRVLTAYPAFLGAEDFAVFGQVIPSHFYWMGTGFLDQANPLHHQPGFQVNPDAIPYGVALLVQSLLEVMEDPRNQERG